jgi:MFS family permease
MLAIVGVVVVAGGFAAGIDGLVHVGALWVVGGLLLRLVVGSPKDLEKPGTGVRVSEVVSSKRGAATLGVVAIGVASIVLGLVGAGFEGHEAWRWLPVALGVFMAGGRPRRSGRSDPASATGRSWTRPGRMP